MTITLEKREYTALKKDAEAYRKIISSGFEKAISSPVPEIVRDFKLTNKYSEGFISDLESGLLKSSLNK